MNDILRNIDAIRRNKGYSQEYLASQIGIKQAGFSLIMSGERELKYNTLLQIANALQESVIDIIAYPEKYILSRDNNISTETVLQIKLDNDKKEQVLKIVFGDEGAELLRGK
ncbi:helix-turn-helix transcriptional regulator [uncultured Parabacteroides sp.]|jgi:transcriptional regulator with XRE-family HTH domain|uniref:helix-turn-helix domain-containing protein n=1 Tax=uncultured Parabacteroides sp. TaxID=512312 RepID=UPI0025E4319A|nr:helix-turn-helix transcriptional regulator [uncultured Parabacteroides sp.]